MQRYQRFSAIGLCLALAACQSPEPPAGQTVSSTPAATPAAPVQPEPSAPAQPPAPGVSDTSAAPPRAESAAPVPAASAAAPDPQPPEDTSVAAMTEEAKRSAATATQAASDDEMDQVADALRDYLRRQGAPEDGGIANKGGVSVEFAVGFASIAVPPGSAGFGDARPLAFERAFQNALGQMALTRGRKVESLVSASMMQDTTSAATYAEACKPDATEAALMKVTQLVNAQLDNALRQLDVPESEITAQTPVYRCENPQMRDAISTATRTRALASMRGVRIVKSVMVGQEVGVAIAVSPNFVAAAQSLARGEASRTPLPTASEEILAGVGALEDGQLLAEYGTRMVKLSNGETALFAFGQAAANVTANDQGAFRSTKRRAAQSAAMRMAEGQLAQFSKVTTYFAGDEQRFAEIAQTLVTENGVASEEQTSNVARVMNESIRSAAELRMQGAMTVKRWSSTDPDSGDLIEGVVLAWSPSLAGASGAANRPTQPAGAAPRQTDRPATRAESAERQEDW